MKKTLTILLILLAALGILIMGLAGCSPVTEGGGEAAAEDEPAPTEQAQDLPAPEPFDEGTLREWIIAGALEKAPSVSRSVSLEEVSYQTVKEGLKTAISELFEQNPYFNYTVSNLTFDTPYHKNYMEINLDYEYADNRLPFDQLPRAGTENALFQQLQDDLKKGERSFAFLLDGEGTEQTAEKLAAVLTANSAEIAAECHHYRYRTVYSAADGETLVVIALAYPDVNERQLGLATTEMRAALDQMAQEIRGLGETDRETLYRLAAKAVMDSAEYDADLAAATPEAGGALSGEQRIQRSAYGAVLGGGTVCSGYSLAMKALCDRLDLPCWCVGGSWNGAAHMWNVICLDGESLYIDCTNADTGGGEAFLFMTQQNIADKGYSPDETGEICPWAA